MVGIISLISQPEILGQWTRIGPNQTAVRLGALFEFPDTRRPEEAVLQTRVQDPARRAANEASGIGGGPNRGHNRVS